MQLVSKFKRFLRNKSYAVPKLHAAEKIKRSLDAISDDKAVVLIATNTGSHWSMLSVDILLGIALRLRGQRVKFILCDGVLKACQLCEISSLGVSEMAKNGPRSFCKSCFQDSSKILVSLGFETIRLSKHLNEAKLRSEEAHFKVLEQARAGFIRYMAKADIDHLSVEETKVFEKYVFSAEASYQAYLSILNEEKPSRVVCHHGIYVPQGLALYACEELEIPVYCWVPMYRAGTILLSKQDTYHRTLPTEGQESFADFQFQEPMRQSIRQYLISRESGKNDWISFNRPGNSGLVQRVIGSEDYEVTYLLLTNVIWDAQVHYRASAYSDMLSWIIDTIAQFQGMPKKRLIIRIHPGEKKGTVKSRQSTFDEIKRHYKSLPPNILIIDADDEYVSTYDLIDLSDAAIIYGTKAGIEIAARGKRVIVVGDAWCRGKGFTIDAVDMEDYHKILRNRRPPRAMSEEEIRLAEKYAYYLFFRRSIEITSLKPLRKFSPFVIKKDISDAEDILCDKGLMGVADAIIRGDDVIQVVPH